MTNKEYQAMLADIIEKFPSEETPHPAKVMCEWIKSLEAENAALTLLHTQATDQMIKMQNRVHELEAEIAQVKKINWSLMRVFSHKDETISVIRKTALPSLSLTNRSLVEQMNQMAMRMEHKSWDMPKELQMSRFVKGQWVLCDGANAQIEQTAYRERSYGVAAWREAISGNVSALKRLIPASLIPISRMRKKARAALMWSWDIARYRKYGRVMNT